MNAMGGRLGSERFDAMENEIAARDVLVLSHLPEGPLLTHKLKAT